LRAIVRNGWALTKRHRHRPRKHRPPPSRAKRSLCARLEEAARPHLRSARGSVGPPARGTPRRVHGHQVAGHALSQARHVERMLRVHGCPIEHVQPVVALWGQFDQRSVLSGSVAWVRGSELARVLAARPPALSPPQVAQITAAVRAALGLQ
jgi:hypothetical protein